MKHLSFFLLSVSLTVYGVAQEHRPDNRPVIIKEDSYNQHRSEQITNIDLLQALETAGITIHKFSLGEFDSTYKFSFILEEFKDGKLVKEDTLFTDDNQYHYYLPGKKEYFLDYLDQIKIFAQAKDSSITFHFKTAKLEFKRSVKQKKVSKKSFYNLRAYADTKWKFGQKIPMLVYASSWEDKKFNVERFCGVVMLADGDEGTQELLTSSPHYYRVSYLIW